MTYYFGSAENCDSLCAGQNLICAGEHIGQLTENECLAIHRQSNYEEVDSAKTQFPLNTPAASAKVTSFEVKSNGSVSTNPSIFCCYELSTCRHYFASLKITIVYYIAFANIFHLGYVQ